MGESCIPPPVIVSGNGPAASETTTSIATSKATTESPNKPDNKYEEILEDLCRRMETSKYYTSKSSPWFLRGALTKYDEEHQQEQQHQRERKQGDNNPNPNNNRFRFRTGEFTNVLVARLMQQQQQQQHLAPKEQHGCVSCECESEWDDRNDISRSTEGKNDDDNGECKNKNKNNDNYTKKNKAKHCKTPPDYCLMVTRSLLQADSSKYLPAITASLSNWVSSVITKESPSTNTIPTPTASTKLPIATTISPISPTSLPISPISTSTSTSSIPTTTIPRGVLRLWVSLIADHSTPLEIHDQLSNILLDVILHRYRCRYCHPQNESNPESESKSARTQNESNDDDDDDDDPLSLPADVLAYLIANDNDGDDKNHASSSRKLKSAVASSSSSSSSSVVRRASFLIRFLSRCYCTSPIPVPIGVDNTNTGTHNNTEEKDKNKKDDEGLAKVAKTSGAIDWFVRVLQTEFGKPSPVPLQQQQQQQRYKYRLRLLDVVLEESKAKRSSQGKATASSIAATTSLEDDENDNGNNNDTHPMEWMISTKVLSPVFLKFLRDASIELVEEWKQLLFEASPSGTIAMLTTTTTTPKNKPHHQHHQLHQHHQQQQHQHQDQRTTNEIGSRPAALDCAKRFIRILSRLLPLLSLECSFAFPASTSPFGSTSGGDIHINNNYNHDHDQHTMLLPMDKATFKHGMCLFAKMLRDETVSLQQLRLVRLLIDEFGAIRSCNSKRVTAVTTATTNTTNTNKYTTTATATIAKWLSSPTMLPPVLKQCAEDPFLLNSNAARRYVEAYNNKNKNNTNNATTTNSRNQDACWKSIHRKPLRAAPMCRFSNDHHATLSASTSTSTSPSTLTSPSTTKMVSPRQAETIANTTRRSPLVLLRNLNLGDVWKRNMSSSSIEFHQYQQRNYVSFNGEEDRLTSS